MSSLGRISCIQSLSGMSVVKVCDVRLSINSTVEVKLFTIVQYRCMYESIILKILN